MNAFVKYLTFAVVGGAAVGGAYSAGMFKAPEVKQISVGDAYIAAPTATPLPPEPEYIPPTPTPLPPALQGGADGKITGMGLKKRTGEAPVVPGLVVPVAKPQSGPAPAGANWRLVQSWSGNGGKTATMTNLFAIRSIHWRVEWETSSLPSLSASTAAPAAGNLTSEFVLSVFAKNGAQVGQSVKQAGSAKGYLSITGAGDYYLRFEGLQPFKVRVVQGG